MTERCPVRAFFRPRHNDVRVIARNGETLDIPAADVPDLLDALAAAMGMPAHVHALISEHAETAWSAR